MINEQRYVQISDNFLQIHRIFLQNSDSFTSVFTSTSKMVKQEIPDHMPQHA